MLEPLLVLVTTGSQAEAETIAQALVAERLAACVNVVPGITSIYHWQGEVQRDQEWLLLVKSRHDALDDVVRRVRELHSYDLPETIALPIVGGSAPYLAWLQGEIRGE